MSIYIEPKEKWEKTTENNGIKTTKTVGKVENGYVIVKTISGERGDPKEYFSESTAFISKDNPLEQMDVEAGVKDLVDKF